MESNMVGSHVVRRPDARGSRRFDDARNASSVEFSNGRRRNEANRGFVSQVGVSATSGEDAGAYSRRVSRLGYIEEMQRRARRKRIAFFLVVFVLVVVVAAGAGVAAYFSSTDSKLSLGSSNAKDALVKPVAGEPYYMLLAADLGSASGSDASRSAYLLVRVDEGARTVSVADIPANLDVRLSDGKNHPLSDAVAAGGDAELINQVAEFASVDIAHYAKTDAKGLAGMVAAVGGITVTLPEEVDDPRAGIEVLSAGEQSLQGASTLVALRASNYVDGYDTTVKIRAAVLSALSSAALGTAGLDFASLVSDAGTYVNTDLTASQLMDLGDSFRPFDQAVVYACLPPGYESTGDEQLYEVYGTEWAAMLERFKAGEDPNVIESSEAGVNPADFTVEVRNGAGATGAASRMAEMLTSAGFVVEGVGNVDDATTYPETLVIYKDAANEGAAKVVVRAGNGGRVVNGGDFYTFETDVLVIIGQDWMPVS